MKRPQFDESWSDSVRELNRHDRQEWWEPDLQPHIWRQYQNQLRRYLRFAPPGKRLDILDVGCAQATLALLLAERGHRVVAVDLRGEFLEYARIRHERGDISFIQGNAMELNLDRQFDLVFANQILEHVVYPERLLERLASHVRPGGRLVVTTPNWRYVRNPHPSFTALGDRTQFEHLQFTADGDGHFFAYDADELVALVRDAGFSDVDATVFESPAASGHMKARFVTRWLPMGLVEGLDKLICALPWIGRRVSHQLLVTGTKPEAPQ